MGLLWFGTEDVDFETAVSVSTTATYFNSTRTRCALSTVTAGVYVHSPSFANVTSLWLKAVVYDRQLTDTWTNLFGLAGAGTVKGIYVASSGAANLSIVKYDGSTETVLATSTLGSHNREVLEDISLSIEDYGATGTATIYVNGILHVTYTGDLSLSGISYLNHVVFMGKRNYGGATGTIGSYLSEFIVDENDTRSMILSTIAPNAVGTTNSWTGGYTNCDEVTITDTDYIYTNENAKDFQCNLSTIPSGEYGISGVKVVCRATVSEDAAISGLSLGIQSGSTISVTTAVSLTSAWASYEYMMETNPVTGNAFTQDEIGALQITLRSAT